MVVLSVFGSARPEKFHELLKHMHLIRLGAKKSTLVWKSHDEQFRLRASQNPSLSWVEMDCEWWFIYMYGSTSNPPTPLSNEVYKCYAFNYNGQCSKLNCPYSHCCFNCFGLHPLKSCFRQNSRTIDAQRQRFTKPSFSQTTNSRGS